MDGKGVMAMLVARSALNSRRYMLIPFPSACLAKRSRWRAIPIIYMPQCLMIRKVFWL